MIRNLLISALSLALVISARSVQAEDGWGRVLLDKWKEMYSSAPLAKSIVGSWKMDALSLIKEDEGYKNASAEEKRAMERAAQEMTFVLEITADTLTTVTTGGGKEDMEVAAYKVKKWDGKTLTIETTDAKKNVEEANLEVVFSEKKMKIGKLEAVVRVKKLKVSVEGVTMLYIEQKKPD